MKYTISEQERSRLATKYMQDSKIFFYPPCIVPGWERLTDEIIHKVKTHNETSTPQVRIFQMKLKFGTLVVYLEPVDPEWTDGVPAELEKQVNNIVLQSRSTCPQCGNKQVKTVDNSRLAMRCLKCWL